MRCCVVIFCHFSVIFVFSGTETCCISGHVPKEMANFAVEEYELFGDPKYRSYVSAIDKVLKHFESTSEWADLISALGKLNKVPLLLLHLHYI